MVVEVLKACLEIGCVTPEVVEHSFSIFCVPGDKIEYSFAKDLGDVFALASFGLAAVKGLVLVGGVFLLGFELLSLLLQL